MARGGYNSRTTLSDFLIAFLCSARSTSTFYRILREREMRRQKPDSVYTSLYRLKAKGLIKREVGGWRVTEEGRIHFKWRERLLFLSSPFPKNAPDALIISFDIPETRRRMRDWLRSQLKIFGYRIIHQSVWIGPGPLPKEFFERISELEIKKNIRFFKIK